MVTDINAEVIQGQNKVGRVCLLHNGGLDTVDNGWHISEAGNGQNRIKYHVRTNEGTISHVWQM